MQGWTQKSGRVLGARGGRHILERPSIGAKSVQEFGCISYLGKYEALRQVTAVP